MKLIVLSHVWNESFLMPYWLRHHMRIFDHGIIINYSCTDDTIDIIRGMTDWDVIPARYDYFGAIETDNHIEDLEQQIVKRFGPDTWKIALNTTEFLFHDDVKGVLEQQEGNDVKAYGVVMVDHPEQRHDSLESPDLFSQKFFGRFDLQHQRLLHKRPKGNYSAGRHNWKDEGATPLIEDMFLLWFGWSPIEYVKERKLQIQKRIPEHDRANGRGWHHFMDEQLLEKRYLTEEVTKSYWLHMYDHYLNMTKKVHKKYGLEMILPSVELVKPKPEQAEPVVVQA